MIYVIINHFMQLHIYYNTMFRRGKSHSEIGLVSKQLFAEESHSNAQTISSYAFGPSAFIRSEIITDHRDNKKVENSQNSRKGRTFSSSSSKIFMKAHSVSKEETFLKKKVETKQSLSNTKEKLVKHNEEVQRLKNKILMKQAEVDRKLLIKRVLENKANNSQMSIIQEMNASRNILVPEKRNALTLLSNESSWAHKQKNRHQETQPHIQIQTVNKEKRVLKTEQNKNLWIQGAVSQQFRHDLTSSFVNNDSATKKEGVGMQELKIYMSQMQMSLKQSIREQIEVAYNNKQKQILQNYQNTLKQYDNKLTAIEGEVAKKKESEQKMMEGLIKVFESKVQEIIKKNVEQISKIKQESPFKTNTQQTFKQETKFNMPREQSIKRQIQKQVKQIQKQVKQVQKHVQEVPVIEEIKAVQRKPAIKQSKNTQIAQKRSEANSSLKSQTKQPAKGFKKNIYQEASSNNQFQIEEIKLNLESKNVGNSRFKNAVAVKDQSDLSFQYPGKLPDQSFDSERPNPKKETTKINNNQKPIKTDKSASLRNYPQKNESPPIEQKSREQKPKQVAKQQPNQAENRKLQLRKLLMKQTQQDPYLTAAGQVVSYCNKLMKKSKLKWRLPSLLLYRYCYDGYRLHTPLYEQGLKVGLLKPQDVQKFKSESVMLRDNMMKVLKAVIKKNELDAAYQKLIQSEENMVQKLRKLIERQVKKFIDELWQSDQVGDVNVLQCALRMINGVFIVRKLNGNQSIAIIDKIEDLGERQIKSKFEQWVDKLDQLLANNK